MDLKAKLRQACGIVEDVVIDSKSFEDCAMRRAMLQHSWIVVRYPEELDTKLRDFCCSLELKHAAHSLFNIKTMFISWSDKELPLIVPPFTHVLNNLGIFEPKASDDSPVKPEPFTHVLNNLGIFKPKASDDSPVKPAPFINGFKAGVYKDRIPNPFNRLLAPTLYKEWNHGFELGVRLKSQIMLLDLMYFDCKVGDTIVNEPFVKVQDILNLIPK